jgi:hypothetical protein
MRRERTLRLASAALIPFHVAPALLLAALAGPFTRRAYGGALAAWLPTWAGFALPLLVWALLSGRWLEGALLLGQAALGLAAGAFMRGPARPVRVGLLAALCALALAGAAGAWLGPRSFRAYEGHRVATRLGPAGIYQRVSGGGEGQPSASRSWLLSGAAPLRLEARVRLAGDDPSWLWSTRGPAAVTRGSEPGAAHAVLGDGGEVLRFADPYLLAGSDEVRGAVTWSAAGAAEACVTVSLRTGDRVLGRSARECLAPGAGPRTTSLVAPAVRAAAPVELVVSGTGELNLDGGTVEVKGAVWRSVGPLGPGSVLLTLDWPGRTEPARARFTPGADWTDVAIAVPTPVDAPFVIARVHLPPGAAVDLAGVRLSATEGPDPSPPPPTRQGLFFGGPVTLSHVAVALATGLVAGGAGPRALLVGAASLGVIGLTSASRGALLAVGAWVVLLLGSRRPRRLLLAAVVALAAGLTAYLVQLGREPDLASAVPRTQIWTTALAAVRDHPVLGLTGAGETFEAYAAERGAPRSVAHAHDLWLDLASRYGVLGGLAALALVVGLVRSAWRRAGARGAIVLLPVLALNVIDSTLLQGPVLVATVLAVNLLGEARAGEDGAPAQPASRDQ